MHHERGFANSWVSAKENQRTGDKAPSKHSVKLFEIGLDPGNVFALDLGQRYWLKF